MNIKPHHIITKRGLINGLGSIIKTISGNMDNDDAELLNRQIETIKLNEHDLKGALNQQISLNNKLAEKSIR